MDKRIILILATLFLCVIIFLHHYYIHRLEEEKTFAEKIFQWDDVNNHETVIIGLLGFILGLVASFWL